LGQKTKENPLYYLDWAKNRDRSCYRWCDRSCGLGLWGAGLSLFQGSHIFSSGDPSIAIVSNHLLNISGWIFTFGAIAAGVWITYEVVADGQPLVFIIKPVLILIGMGMSVYAIAKLIFASFM
jgi:hypothetical protein